MNTTISRCKLLLNDDKNLIDLLEVLHFSRNSFVHEGSFPNENGFNEIMFLKQIVDQIIFNFAKLIETHKTKKEIEYYFKYSMINNKDLLLINQITQDLINHRKDQ